MNLPKIFKSKEEREQQLIAEGQQYVKNPAKASHKALRAYQYKHNIKQNPIKRNGNELDIKIPNKIAVYLLRGSNSNQEKVKSQFDPNDHAEVLQKYCYDKWKNEYQPYWQLKNLEVEPKKRYWGLSSEDKKSTVIRSGEWSQDWWKSLRVPQGTQLATQEVDIRFKVEMGYQITQAELPLANATLWVFMNELGLTHSVNKNKNELLAQGIARAPLTRHHPTGFLSAITSPFSILMPKSYGYYAPNILVNHFRRQYTGGPFSAKHIHPPAIDNQALANMAKFFPSPLAPFRHHPKLTIAAVIMMGIGAAIAHSAGLPAISLSGMLPGTGTITAFFAGVGSCFAKMFESGGGCDCGDLCEKLGKCFSAIFNGIGGALECFINLVDKLAQSIINGIEALGDCLANCFESLMNNCGTESCFAGYDMGTGRTGLGMFEWVNSDQNANGFNIGYITGSLSDWLTSPGYIGTGPTLDFNHTRTQAANSGILISAQNTPTEQTRFSTTHTFNERAYPGLKELNSQNGYALCGERAKLRDNKKGPKTLRVMPKDEMSIPTAYPQQHNEGGGAAAVAPPPNHGN